MRKNGKKLGFNVKKAAKHALTKAAYEELPELTDAMAARGVFKQNGKKIGRPKKEDKKVSVHLRLDPDVRDAFRRSGAGWQTRMNAILRAAMEEQRV